MSSQRSYLPAAGRDWLLWTYDPWAKLVGADAIRSTLVSQMDLQPGQRILDIGCGTGSLVVLLKQLHPDICVVGLDADAPALALAKHKAHRAGVEAHFDRGFSNQLPYADASFDRVSCTFMLSLLPRAEKEATLRDVRRVLRESGSFHLLDLAKMPPGGWFVRLLRSSQQFDVCKEEEIIALMRQAGFSEANKTNYYPMWLWPVASYRAWLS